MKTKAGLPLMPFPHPAPPSGFDPTPRLSNQPLNGPSGPGAVQVKTLRLDGIFTNAYRQLRSAVQAVQAKRNIMHMRACVRARGKFIFCSIFFFILKNTWTTRTK